MNNDENKYSHLVIPEGDIEKVVYEPQSRPKPIPRNHVKHGEMLLEGFKSITELHNINESSLGDDIVTFKVELHEGQSFQSKERQKFLSGNKIKINALKNSKTAIVSSEIKEIRSFKNKLENYKNSNRNLEFQYIEELKPFEISDKQSPELKEILSNENVPEKEFDLQLMLIPSMSRETYDKTITKIKEKLESIDGKLLREPYFLSNGTPVVRAQIALSQVDFVSSDEAVFRIELTNFFDFKPSEIEIYDISNIALDEEVNIETLPKVVVLDNGVDFSNNELLKPLLKESILSNGVNSSVGTHGTAVASRVIFGDNINTQIRTGKLKPRAKIIDVCIFDGNQVSEDIFLERIQNAVKQYHQEAKIYNLSMNFDKPIDPNNISILAYEIDNLISNYGVMFVISAGNHQIWRHHNNIKNVLEDDDIIIASPAESVLALTVGSINSENDPNSLTRQNELSPYSRIGLGFALNEKPDLVAYGGNLSAQNGSNFGVPAFCQDGKCTNVSGTSFAAPVVAGDLACILANIQESNLLLAKGLLLHTAFPLYDYENLTEDDIAFNKKLYGNGLCDVNRALYSKDSSVTYICQGELDRLNKQRIKFYMPQTLAGNSSNKNPAVVTVTCLTLPPLDFTKGTEYLGAYANASLHKVGNEGSIPSCNPDAQTGRKKWQPWQHFKKSFCRFNPGDWQVWLQLSTRWEIADDQKIPYLLAITIEDPTGKIPIYPSIQAEVPNRYQPLIKPPIQIRQRV